MYFMLVGFAQQGLLGSLLGAEAYGMLARASAIANIANNVIITGSVQGASRVATETDERLASGAQRGVLRLQVALALPLAVGFAAVSIGFALLTGASHLVPLLLAASVIVAGYTVYAPLVGSLNGRRRFGAQALLDTVYATGRTVAMLLGARLLLGQGRGPLGAMVGFALAALAIVPLAVFLAGTGRAGPGAPSARAYLASVGPLALGQFFLNSLMQSDISLLGYLTTRDARAAGLGVEAAAAVADRSAGIYKACQLFSFLPYQLLVSVTFILFPLLTRAAHDDDRVAIALYVKNGLRLALLLASVMVAVIYGLAPHLLRLTFKADISNHGASTLRTLALGQGAFALYGICAAALASLHRERVTVVVNAGATALLIVLSCGLVPGAAAGAPAAERAALATSLALGTALLIGGVLLRRAAGSLVPLWTVVRIVGAGVVTGLIGTVLPVAGTVATLAAAGGLGVVYLLILVVTGELGRQDAALVGRVLGRR